MDTKIIKKATKGLQEAYLFYRDEGLTYKACPKCQHEAYKNNYCRDCGFGFKNIDLSGAYEGLSYTDIVDIE